MTSSGKIAAGAAGIVAVVALAWFVSPRALPPASDAPTTLDIELFCIPGEVQGIQLNREMKVHPIDSTRAVALSRTREGLLRIACQHVGHAEVKLVETVDGQEFVNTIAIEVGETISQKDSRQAFAEQDQLAFCRTQKDLPEGSREVVLRYLVAPDGAVQRTDSRDSTAAKEHVDCVRQKLKAMKFPAARKAGMRIGRVTFDVSSQPE